jgi:hypothetical protein
VRKLDITKQHITKKWIVSIIAIDNQFKVTRRLPELSIAETKLFTSIEKAKRQFEEWLQ